MQDTGNIKTNALMSIQILTVQANNERTKNVMKDNADLK